MGSDNWQSGFTHHRVAAILARMRIAACLFLVCAPLMAAPCAAQNGDSLAQPPKPATSPGTWVLPEDYPPEALRADLTGTVAFKVTVDADGRVTACEVTETSGSPELDVVACEKVKERARFTPATDNDGSPVGSEWASRVVWQLEDTLMPMPAPGYFVAAFSVEADGSVSDCAIQRAEGGATQLAAGFCEMFEAVEPILDDEGNPVRRRVRIMSRVVHEPPP
jgi:TonB family protein